MALILGIESTCDETGAAVVEGGTRVRSDVVASQVELHARYRGVVPEIASRAHIENLLPVLHDAVAQAGCTLDDLDAIAVAHRPGLIGSLLIGVTAAKTLAWTLGKPLVAVDHVHAHLYSVMLEREGSGVRVQGSGNAGSAPGAASSSSSLNPEPRTLTPSFPAVGLVCSGGHTALYRVGSWEDVELIGSTIDDAVGEAYDKVAAILGLGYPGGPVIDRLAAEGDPTAVRFPRTLLGRDSLDFSFSGLKTSVLYHVRGVPGRKRAAGDDAKRATDAGAPVPDDVRLGAPAPGGVDVPLSTQAIRDVCASFQAACIDVITTKLRRAVRQAGARGVILGGGVSANRGLRAALATFDVPVHLPPLRYCTDNAAMTAGLAAVHLRAGRTATLDLDAVTYSAFAR